MTVKEGYLKIFHFLDNYYQKTKHDELGGLLGDMDNNIWSDGSTNDPAMPGDWEGVQEKHVITDNSLNSEQCYQAMIRFLTEELRQGIWVEDIINELINNPELKTLWNEKDRR